MSFLSTEPVGHFTRKFICLHPDPLIESCCDLCGLSFIGEDAEALRRDEEEHREACDAKEAPDGVRLAKG